MGKFTPLEIATRHYFWKPMAALFRATELRIYQDSQFKIEGRILDLGCGDGQVAGMLMELGVSEQPLCGVEISPVEMDKARRARTHKHIVQADANRLPFKDNSFTAVFSNGVLAGIPNSPDGAISEAYRILTQGGCYVATMPTHLFLEMLMIPKILERISLKAARNYSGKINARMPHCHTYSTNEWERAFSSKGFVVINRLPYFSKTTGKMWDVLTLQIFRICGLLKLVPLKFIRKSAAVFLKNAFRKAYLHEKNVSGEEGYLLIIARKY